MLITSHYVDIDTPGKQNDANVLKNSINSIISFKNSIVRCTTLLPPFSYRWL